MKGISIASTNPLNGLWLGMIRGMWYLAAFLTILIAVASIPGYIEAIPNGFIQAQLAVNSSKTVIATNILAAFCSLAAVFLSLLLAYLLFRRRPDDRMAIFLSFYLLGFALYSGPAGLVVQVDYGLSIETLIQVIVPNLIMYPASCILFLVFPDGRFATPWSRWITLAAFITAPIMTVLDSNALADSSRMSLAAAGTSLPLVVMSGVMYAQYYRYRYVASIKQRQQIKWFVYGLGIMLFLIFGSGIPYFWSLSLPEGTLFPIVGAISVVIYFLSLAILPLSLTIAVMRYGLYDIDILINRTLVYGSLSLLIVALYVAVVGGLGVLFQAQGNFIIAFFATAMVAILFQPLRARLQRKVNRMLYGERHDPLMALSNLSKQLETTVMPQDVLPTLVQTIADTLKLPYVAISLHENGRFKTVAEAGDPVLDVISLPLVYQGQRVGQLVVAQRSTGETFSKSEMKLVRTIARQAGAAVHSVRLTAELQYAREHLVETREEERRRLRRDLHDGLGPTLAGQSLKLELVSELFEKDPDKAQRLLSDIKRQSQQTVSQIRGLVYDLRPPALDDLGLTGALQTHIYQIEGVNNSLQISFKSSDNLPPLSAAVEVAAYRIVQEGLNNVVCHSQASECQIQVSTIENAGQFLQLEVIDNGIGLPENYKPGVGLASMRERAAELGGTFAIERRSQKGTRVVAILPLKSRAVT